MYNIVDKILIIKEQVPYNRQYNNKKEKKREKCELREILEIIERKNTSSTDTKWGRAAMAENLMALYCEALAAREADADADADGDGDGDDDGDGDGDYEGDQYH